MYILKFFNFILIYLIIFLNVVRIFYKYSEHSQIYYNKYILYVMELIRSN